MTELKDLFLPYEESLAMRELGFNLECFGYYDSLGHYSDFEYYDLENTNSCLQSDYGGTNKVCTAILYQQTLDFFRKKGYHIEIYSDNHQDILNADNWYWLFSKGVNTSSTNSFESYEEARLDCIRALIETELNIKA